MCASRNQTGCGALPRPTPGEATPALLTLLYSHELSNVHTATYRRARSISSQTELPIFAALSVVTGTELFVPATPTCSVTFGGRTRLTFGCRFPLMGRSEESHRLKGVVKNGPFTTTIGEPVSWHPPLETPDIDMSQCLESFPLKSPK